MKRKIAASLISAVLVFVFGLFQAGEVPAGDVDVNIGIGIGVPPPRLVVPTPPSVYLIPGSYVYYAPDLGAQIFSIRDTGTLWMTATGSGHRIIGARGITSPRQGCLSSFSISPVTITESLPDKSLFPMAS
jgi:hypothetical protein